MKNACSFWAQEDLGNMGRSNPPECEREAGVGDCNCFRKVVGC